MHEQEVRKTINGMMKPKAPPSLARRPKGRFKLTPMSATDKFRQSAHQAGAFIGKGF